MSHLDTIRRAADSLKLPFVVTRSMSGRLQIDDATGNRICTINIDRTRHASDAFRDAQNIVDIVNAATELARESK